MPDRPQPNRRGGLTPDQVAAQAGVKPGTLAVWASRGIPRDGTVLRLQPRDDGLYDPAATQAFLARLADSPRKGRGAHTRPEPATDRERDRRRLGETVRALRLARGMRARDLAAHMDAAGFGWSAQIVQDTESGGRRALKFDEAVALAALLGVDVNQLAEGMSRPPAPPRPPAGAGAGVNRERIRADEAMTWAPWEGQRPALERWAQAVGVDRSEATRRLVQDGLER